mgnify:FL=1
MADNLLGNNVNFVCSIDEEIVISTKTKYKKPRPSYTTIGNGMKTRHFQSFPYEKVLLDLTANETRLYKLILEAYNYKTGYSFVDTSNESQSVKTELSKGYKGLKSKCLVKRVKQQTYLINPCAKIHLELFDELYTVWNKLVD